MDKGKYEPLDIQVIIAQKLGAIQTYRDEITYEGDYESFACPYNPSENEKRQFSKIFETHFDDGYIGDFGFEGYGICNPFADEVGQIHNDLNLSYKTFGTKNVNNFIDQAYKSVCNCWKEANLNNDNEIKKFLSKVLELDRNEISYIEMNNKLTDALQKTSKQTIKDSIKPDIPSTKQSPTKDAR